MRWARNLPRLREKRNAYRILVGRLEGKRSLELRETGCDDMDWIHLAQDRDGNEHPGSIKCWEILEQLSVFWLLKKYLAPWSYLLT
jgi:hypothetical protein